MDSYVDASLSSCIEMLLYQNLEKEIGVTCVSCIYHLNDQGCMG